MAHSQEQITKMTTANLDIGELFDVLESNHVQQVEEIKNLITENFNKTKESWLVGGLFDYYLQTNSTRCLEILCGISREPHDKYLIEKICEGIRLVPSRKQSLTFLGYLVRKAPSWLYKIVQHSLIKELFKVLRTETDTVNLLTSLLTIITLLPIIPTYLINYTNDIFEVFGRVAAWTHSNKIAEEHVLHLQVALYSLFHRLYAMYPCNFLSYLRHTFSAQDKKYVFLHTIKPMLETVKMHPLLVTASKEGELYTSRWRSKEPHDVMAECAKISLDLFESGYAEESSASSINNNGKSRFGSNFDPPIFTLTECPGANSMSVSSSFNDKTLSPFIGKSLNSMTDFNTLANWIDDTGSAPPTPISGVVVNYPPKVTPPETAMEATPENTPIATPVKEREQISFKLPSNSAAVMQLAFGSGSNKSIPPTPTVTPSNSVPSSPLPRDVPNQPEGLPLFHRRDSIFDTVGAPRRDSAIFQRLQKVLQEQQARNPDGTESSASVLNFEPRQLPSPITIPLQPTENPNEFQTIPSHEASGGPLTPHYTHHSLMIHHEENEDDPTAECQSTCPSGGLHMPDHKSMLDFAKRVSRLRFYSQCGSSSPGTSPSSICHFPPALNRSRVKRSFSCPDMSKLNNKLDQIKVSSRDESPMVEVKKPKEGIVPIQPYEHLFEGIIPSSTYDDNFPSPHLLLDNCLSKAAALHGKSIPRSTEEQLIVLKGQVELLHCQLMFERHRREAFTLRNRRLAGKLRQLEGIQENNNSLRGQIHSLEKEVANLKKELLIQRNSAMGREKELSSVVESLETKVVKSRETLRQLQEGKSQDENKYSKLLEEFNILKKETDEKKAELFTLQSEVRHAQRTLEVNSGLKKALGAAQKEIILLGELIRKREEYMENSILHDNSKFILEEMEDYRLTAEDEIGNLKNQLENSNSQCEAARGLVRDLETQLVKKDLVMNDMRKKVHDTVSEYVVQLKAVEDKYEAVKAANHRLELEILNLQHQLALKSYSSTQVTRGSRRVNSSSSPNSNGGGGSNHSDVESAASAGGYGGLSPDRQAGIFIFGSPQFDAPAEAIRDLQAVIDRATTGDS